jgi:ubiquinone/menaquinone biosynthesis C-methylase UbiE
MKVATHFPGASHLRRGALDSKKQEESSMPDEKRGRTVETCDVFDFMAVHLGLSVLHPGGLAATAALAETLNIGPDTSVLDVGCGKGTGAVFLAKKTGCRVTGVDLSAGLIEDAKALAGREGLQDRVQFRIGNAMKLPFSDRSFDTAVSQAVLVLVPDQERAVREAMRVIRPGRAAGWLELGWKKPATPEFMTGLSEALRASSMRNVHTFDGWKKLFLKAGLKQFRMRTFDMGRMGLMKMRSDEGFIRFLRILLKTASDGAVRRRMKTMSRFFREHADHFGYGIFAGMK